MSSSTDPCCPPAAPEPSCPPCTPGQRIIDVPTTVLYGDRLYGKPRAARIDQGIANALLRIPIQSDETGAPLTVCVGPYGTTPTVQARYREATGFLPYLNDTTGSLSPDGRHVLIPIPCPIADLAGVHTMQFRILDSTGVERDRNEIWVYVDRGMWTTLGDPCSDTGIPTTRELRNALRDHPGANRLLGEYEFDVAELSQAVVSAVQAFDAEFPPLNRHLPTTSWPVQWRRPLIDGFLSYIFDVAATYNRRGKLPYSAGGVSIDDLSKEESLLRASQMYREKFTKWCKFVRTSISMRGGFGSQGSGYLNGQQIVGGYWG